ncbi:hypothetical protein BDW66DRAFT_107068 [Aspergillus desertorum]
MVVVDVVLGGWLREVETRKLRWRGRKELIQILSARTTIDRHTVLFVLWLPLAQAKVYCRLFFLLLQLVVSLLLLV